jgi:hypothetical protein
MEMCEHFRQDRSLELEIILSASSKQYHGIEFTDIANLYAILMKSTANGLFTSEGKHMVIDQFYEKGIRHRTFIGGSTETRHKTTISKLDIICPERTGLRLRISLKREEKIQIKTINGMNPVYTRLKEIWQFKYRDRFSYDLSKVASSMKGLKVDISNVTYEVELELLHNSAYLANMSNEHLARTILYKIADLLGRKSSPSTQSEDLLSLHIQK